MSIHNYMKYHISPAVYDSGFCYLFLLSISAIYIIYLFLIVLSSITSILRCLLLCEIAISDMCITSSYNMRNFIALCDGAFI